MDKLNAQQLRKVIDSTRFARNHFEAGYCIGWVGEQLKMEHSEISEAIEKFAEPTNSHSTLQEHHFFKSLIPIYVFHPRSGISKLETVSFYGSGVLISVNGVLFLLTAAHVANAPAGYDIGIRMNDGHIYSLSKGFSVLRGHYPGTYRDTIDIAAFDLSSIDQSPVNESILPLQPTDIDMSEDCMDGNVLTMAGYPEEMQSKSSAHKPMALTGYADNVIPVAKYKYQERINVSVRFGLNSSNSRYSEKGITTVKANPKFQLDGMSGGMIISWPRTYEERSNGTGLKVVGIFHTWHGNINTLVGTRMCAAISYVAHEYPQYFEVDA